jgi:hypothetical protein
LNSEAYANPSGLRIGKPEIGPDGLHLDFKSTNDITYPRCMLIHIVVTIQEKIREGKKPILLLGVVCQVLEVSVSFYCLMMHPRSLLDHHN